MGDLKTDVRRASEEAAGNIERYLELNSPERSQQNQMMMYDEQFEKREEAAGDDVVDRFQERFSK